MSVDDGFRVTSNGAMSPGTSKTLKISTTDSTRYLRWHHGFRFYSERQDFLDDSIMSSRIFSRTAL